MATQKIGKDLKLWIDSSILAFANSFEYSIEARTIKTNTIDSGEWDTFLQYGKGWSGSTDNLIVKATDSSRGYAYIKNIIVATNASVGAKFVDDEGIETSGSVFITNIAVNNGGDEGLLTYKASFLGTGPIV